MTIILLVVVTGLIVGAWYLGRDWWNVKSYMPKGGRLATRWEIWGIIPVLALLMYMISVFERGRKSD